jgi:hypothetical protein
MPFNLDALNEGEWFSLNESERVCLRHADADALEKIHAQTRKKTYEFVLNTKTNSMERVPYFKQTPEQEKLESTLIWDFAIVDWEIKDMNGVPIPCTQENKVKLMKHRQFAEFVLKCLKISEDSKEQQEELERKN